MKSNTKGMAKRPTNFRINVILTYDQIDSFGQRQEMFDVDVPLSAEDTDVRSFLNERFFPLIAEHIDNEDERSAEWLSYISTEADWTGLYYKVTKNCDLHELDEGKWHFSFDDDRLARIDGWSYELKRRFGFGRKCNVGEFQGEVQHRRRI